MCSSSSATTMEKLVVGIFDRKRSIVSKLRQKKQIYDQQLASKLLTHGFPLPPWLSLFPSSDELNKEELMFGLLLPRPAPLTSYTSYPSYLHEKAEDVVATNTELRNELCTEKCASSGDLNEDETSIVGAVHERNDDGLCVNAPCSFSVVPPYDGGETREGCSGGVTTDHGEVAAEGRCVDLPVNGGGTEDGPGVVPSCTLNGFGEKNYVPMSPDDQTDTMVSNTYCRPEESLAKLHRSRSRQKALELRNSAKASGRSCLGKSNDVGIASGGKNGSYDKLISDVARPCELLIPSTLSVEASNREEVAIQDSLNAETRKNGVCHSLSQSRGSDKKDLLSEVNKKDSKSGVHSGKDTSSNSRAPESSVADHHVHLKSSEICTGRMTRSKSGSVQQPGVVIAHNGRITRSRSNHNQSVNGDPAIGKSNISHGDIKISQSFGTKEADARDHNTKPKDEMSVKPKQLDFDEVEDSYLNDSLIRDQGTLEVEIEAWTIEEPSASLPYGVSKSVEEAANDTFSASLTEDCEVSERTSYLSEHVTLSPVTHCNTPGQGCYTHDDLAVVIEDNAVDHELPRLDVDVVCSLSSQKRTYLVTEEQGEHSEEASSVNSPIATITLTENAVEVTECLEKVRHESNSIDDCEVSLDAEMAEHQSTSGAMACGLDLSPVNTLPGTCGTDAPEMTTLGCQANLDISCRSSEVNGFSCSKLPEINALENMLPEFNCSFSVDGSWPGYKRRKIDDQLSYKSASPTVGVNPFLTISPVVPKQSSGGDRNGSSDPTCMLLTHHDQQAKLSESECAAMDIDHTVRFSLCEERTHNTEFLQAEGEDSIEKSHMIQSTSKHSQSSTSSRSKAKEHLTLDPSECFQAEVNVEGDLASDTCCSGGVRNFSVSGETAADGCTADELPLADTTEDAVRSPGGTEEPDFSARSPVIEQMPICVSDADQMRPELDGFILDDKRDSLQDAKVGLLHESIPFLSNTVDQTSLGEHTWKAASLSTPSSPFPTPHKLHLTPGIYRSVPNGALELRTDLLSDDSALQGKSYSDYCSFPSSRFGWDNRKLLLSPLGKGFEGIASKSGGSGERVSGNPELICFPIQEDPESSEEDGNMNEVAEPRASDSIVREPLVEIAVDDQSTLAPNNALGRASLESVCTEAKISDMHNMKSKKSKIQPSSSRQTRPGKENQSLSIGTNMVKKHSESLSSRISKAKLSGTTSMRTRGQSLSVKEPKRNNIVSNPTMKSFLPLVQQKQAASAIPAKREVKVKALETAEAAKRLAEKRENERKEKKVALKLERERLEQENLKQIELTRKLKEDERKKREADNAAKKRQREEEEKKEKERKRKRIEDARCQQKQAAEKLHAWKDESRSVVEDEKADGRNNLEDKIHSQVDKVKKDALSKPVNESIENDRSGVVPGLPITNDNKASVGSSDSGKVSLVENVETLTPLFDKKDQASKLTSQEQSYEISPYQCSDGEEEEEDEVPNKKFMPAWASKSCVAQALSTLKQLDPDTVFPPGSFCNLDEVLLPRRLQQK